MKSSKTQGNRKKTICMNERRKESKKYFVPGRGQAVGKTVRKYYGIKLWLEWNLLNSEKEWNFLNSEKFKVAP